MKDATALLSWIFSINMGIPKHIVAPPQNICNLPQGNAIVIHGDLPISKNFQPQLLQPVTNGLVKNIVLE